ncbi:HAD family hydrolase [Streptomyces cheonanensis]|uniref:HAD family hydrolase n=1 Tax=Streptomyces cheonanensis TaxID=312720 RepID=A0ABN2V4N9_9ACTN
MTVPDAVFTPVSRTLTLPPSTGRTTLPKLIATDLDGTLLRRDGTVSPRTAAALAAAGRAGIEVLFVTGRPARWVLPLREHATGRSLAICGNGAALVDLRSGGTLLAARALPVTGALGLVAALRAAAPGVTFAVERAGGIHYATGYPPLHEEDPTVVGTTPVEELLAEDSPYAGQPLLKLLAHHRELAPDAFLALARSVCGGLGEITRSSPTALLEISAPGVTKASTLALHCARHGIAPGEVVAFGDMPNDLEMLRWAGRAYAMANAHPAVLAAAGRRTLSHQKDGVAVVIEQLLAGG